jgi:hypothetical protein
VTPSSLNPLLQVDGVEFVLTTATKSGGAVESRGLDNPERLAAWTRRSTERFRTLADRLQAGPLEQISGLGPQRHVTLAYRDDAELCVGWQHSLSVEEVRERMKKILALWAS